MNLERAQWTYWRPAGNGVVELGTLSGRSVSLRPHFHDESQVTIVLSGRRRFVVGDDVLELARGNAVYIPAGVPHRSLTEPDGVVCVNAYLPPGCAAMATMAEEIERVWRAAGDATWPHLAGAIRSHKSVADRTLSRMPSIRGNQLRAVAHVAARLRMSREGFSRQFAKRHGLPPRDYWLADRLNDARRLLRAGEPIAAVAAETGFVDQSHLGRRFRQAFGITPGRYRASTAAVTTVPDGLALPL